MIKNGELADADDIMNTFGQLYKNSLQSLFNADYEGFNTNLMAKAGIPDLKNLIYDTGLSSTYYSGVSKYDFSGSTLDSKYWTKTESNTHATVTQSTGQISVNYSYANSSPYEYGYAEIISNGSVGNYITANCVFLLSYTWSYTNANATTSGVPSIEITDGSTSVTVKSYRAGTDGADSSGSSFCRLNINKTNKTAKWTENLMDTEDSTTSLSTLGAGNWYLKFKASGYSDESGGDYRSGSNITLKVLKKLESTAAEFIIPVGTADSTVSNIIPVLNYLSEGTATATFQISADGGSNWTTCTDATICDITNTGTELQLKATLTDDGLNISALSEYGIIYNPRQ